MLSENPEVLHDQLRMGKHPGVEALQNEVSFRLGGQGDQKGVIDIALSILPDGQNFAPGSEALSRCINRIHVNASPQLEPWPEVISYSHLTLTPEH